uniref:Peptidase A1 domain-containing protein n=1 Tax=Oryza glumipatula TaxID=40148 RepID=A0A0D9YDL9_9ORYZ
MDTKLGALALMLPLLLLLSATRVAYGGIQPTPPPASFQAALVRIEPAGINYTRAVQRSRSRLSMLAARAVSNAGAAPGESAQTPLKKGSGDYAMSFGIGTPATGLSGEADTGSDLIWTKCGACARCSPRGSPSYYPTSSSSAAFVACGDRTCGELPRPLCSNVAGGGSGSGNCSYHYAYGNARDTHHYTEGILMTETFTFGDDAAAFPGIAFGCTLRSEGGFGTGSGLVGLGRGKLSLVTQLNVEAFGYRLSSDLSAPSPISFGSLADVTGGNGDSFMSTPLLTNPVVQDLPFYYVGMTGISIGGKLVQIPSGTFSFDRSTGAGGVIFDSGTTLTMLPDPAYTLVRDELLSQMGFQKPPPAANDDDLICFTGGSSTTTFPSMVLHFDGGADMDLSTENYLPQMQGQNGETARCWSVVKSSQALTIIGNIMQMDFHVVFDLSGTARMLFQPPTA